MQILGPDEGSLPTPRDTGSRTLALRVAHTSGGLLVSVRRAHRRGPSEEAGAPGRGGCALCARSGCTSPPIVTTDREVITERTAEFVAAVAEGDARARDPCRALPHQSERQRPGSARRVPGSPTSSRSGPRLRNGSTRSSARTRSSRHGPGWMALASDARWSGSGSACPTAGCSDTLGGRSRAPIGRYPLATRIESIWIQG